MDMKKTAREIGLFEAAVNLSKVVASDDVVQRAGASMPLPDIDIQSRVRKVAQWLLDFDKSIYMFLTPEIALIEAMGDLIDEKPEEEQRRIEVVVSIPRDLDEDATERLRNNLPRNVIAHGLDEPFFPHELRPGNGMIVIGGYLGGDRAMVLPDTYRRVESYRGFLGKKVFVPYVELGAATRYEGWLELNPQRFSAKWRDRNENNDAKQ